MSHQSTLLLATLLFCTSQLGAQATATVRDVTIQVSPATPWTDSGLDLQSSDTLEISATPASVQGASGAPACDPKGVTGTPRKPQLSLCPLHPPAH